MTFQNFRRVRRDVNDDLYSKIIRHGVKRCCRCLRVRDLQAAHIVGRGSYTTRFQLEPVRNAVPLCADCHSWFDSHKFTDVIFDEKKRVFTWKDESYTFLVRICGYTWEDLQKLYIAGQQTSKIKYSFFKCTLTKQLRGIIKTLEEGGKNGASEASTSWS